MFRVCLLRAALPYSIFHIPSYIFHLIPFIESCPLFPYLCLMNKKSSITFLNEVAIGNVDRAFEKYVAAEFTHHNIYFKGDRETLKKAMKESAEMNPGAILDVKKVIEEGDHITVFSHLRHKKEDPGFSVTHILRFKNEKIVELWDVIMQLPKERVNENGAF
jgi:predicted SnoaL-like aldol condensation-catalyzing enzyme